jgi:hypothetical protein
MRQSRSQVLRHSLVEPKPISERAKKGWLAHQSVFPPSSSEDSESEKETEEDTDDERSRMMGKSRLKPRSTSREHEPDANGYAPSASELHQFDPQPPVEDLEEPLLGPDDVVGGHPTKVPLRLQVYHGRFGHWEREGMRKYKGLWLFLTVCIC